MCFGFFFAPLLPFVDTIVTIPSSESPCTTLYHLSSIVASPFGPRFPFVAFAFLFLSLPLPYTAALACSGSDVASPSIVKVAVMSGTTMQPLVPLVTIHMVSRQATNLPPPFLSPLLEEVPAFQIGQLSPPLAHRRSQQALSGISQFLIIQSGHLS